MKLLIHAAALASVALGWLLGSDAFASASVRAVTVTLSRDIAANAETGRLFVIVTDRTDQEPRLVTPFTAAYYFNDASMEYAPFFGQDVEALQPGASVRLSGKEQGYPFARLSELPPGEYSIQAVLHRYERVTPAHGKTIWLPMDDWEGTQFHLSPGNFYSDVRRIKIVAGEGFNLSLTLGARIPPVEQPADTKYLKFRKFRSELASRFWGRDMPVGVNVLLPQGYEEHPNRRYPVVFHMGHFMEFTPLRFPTSEPERTTEPAPQGSPRWLWENWSAADTPRVIVVTLLHPTPFYDDSYFVNSANTGPWQDVLMQELLPYINREFRTIDAPWARTMFGGSTGGWISLYTQVTQSESFGGAWIYCPDMVDYRALLNTDMYAEKNYYAPDGYKWLQPERPYSRTVTGGWSVSARQFGQLSRALGNRSRSGEWIDAYAAMFGPVGPDGYPVPLIDWNTGAIDHRVVKTWRDNGFDLRHYLENNWKTVGPKVRGQLFFLCGDMDQFYCNNAMYLLEDFLKTTQNPPYEGSFRYGRPKIGHTFHGLGLDPWPFAMLREMAGHMSKQQPASTDDRQWHYP
ncbi:alpha/beta hydrolase-fold protein [Steroidobacter cummioxidans]|uniref:alpha/beta hydrolase-fold protein n=1 Tax=Steroidobacter cummioxidans TaxID=1803913 RepID=UPI000E319136|nr:alpha/beta hydrolase-fold protein [Steroidobacter cummioxidans]